MISIPTVFNGTQYRSRLEARWAAMLQLTGWPATYEPFDYDGYFPDLIVGGPQPLLIDVKPHDVMIVGVDPLPQIGYDDHDHPPAGLLGQYFSTDDVTSMPNAFRCRRCGEIGVCHSVQTFTGRPCGHYDGDGNLGSVDPRILQRYWASATNLVKWGGQ